MEIKLYHCNKVTNVHIRGKKVCKHQGLTIISLASGGDELARFPDRVAWIMLADFTDGMMGREEGLYLLSVLQKPGK